MKARATKAYLAWGVKYLFRSKFPENRRRDRQEKPFLVGRYWFEHQHTPSMHGHLVCAFNTRREARDLVKAKKSEWSRYWIVRIRVTVTEAR